MISLKLNTVEEFLKKHSYETKTQEETNQIYINLKVDAHEVPLFFRVIEESEILQLIAFVPAKTRSKTKGEVARLLHLINKDLDIPGFCMDETLNLLFYRVVLYGKQSEVDEDLILSFIRSISYIVDTFLPVIQAVASGNATYDDVVKKLQEQEKKAR